MEENREGASRESIEEGYEKGGENVRAILKIGVGIIFIAAAMYLSLWVVFRYFNNSELREGKLREPAPLVSLREKIPPGPRIQAAPEWDLIELRKEEDKELNSYGWVDKNAGIVRIPIDKAIDLLVEKGLPARQQGGESEEKR